MRYEYEKKDQPIVRDNLCGSHCAVHRAGGSGVSQSVSKTDDERSEGIRRPAEGAKVG